MGYYSTTKKNKLPSHKKTWRNFDNILLSSRNQPEKAIYYMIPTTRYSRNYMAMKTMKRSVGTRGQMDAE